MWYYVYKSLLGNAMCLTIDYKLHEPVEKKGYRYTRPRIAQRDIFVYKVLVEYDNFPTCGFSPYRGFRWDFGVRVNRNMGELIKSPMFFDNVHVGKGLHSCTKISATYYHMMADSANRYPVIIPKGSMVYFGRDNEIVSNSLIVYRTMEDLQSVHGKVAKGVKKEKIAI